MTGMVGAINADGREKYVAKIWLIDEGYVKGVNRPDTGGTIHPIIDRINSAGINAVESVMSRSFAEASGRGEGFGSLSKTGKIKHFVAKCLGNPAAGTLCRAAQEAIADILK